MRLDPLISVGIPTFNRPELLRERLKNVTSQTYRNLEIIVSDNASSNPLVQQVVSEFMTSDSRVRFVRQADNIGASANFAFVCEASGGEYFVWASDDDEWDANFLEVCLANSGEAQLVVPELSLAYLRTGEVLPLQLPALRVGDEILVNLKRFLKNTQPSMVYGLHRRADLANFMSKRNFSSRGGFDAWDVALLYHAVVGGGVTICNGTGYRAGVIEDAYVPKPFGRKSSPGRLSYRGLVHSLFLSTVQSRRLKGFSKLTALLAVLRAVAELVAHLTNVFPQISRPHHRLFSKIYALPHDIRAFLRSRVRT